MGHESDFRHLQRQPFGKMNILNEKARKKVSFEKFHLKKNKKKQEYRPEKANQSSDTRKKSKECGKEVLNRLGSASDPVFAECKMDEWLKI